MHAASGVRETEPLVALARNFRVYAPVVPGFDGTPAHDDVASMEALARLEGEFADEVIGETTDVIGHSFGGWLAAWYTVLHPDKVGQLVLECPAGFRADGAGGLPSDAEGLSGVSFSVFSTTVSMSSARFHVPGVYTNSSVFAYQNGRSCEGM